MTPITLTEDDRQTLQRWVWFTKTEQRMVLRARIILAAAEGCATQAIAQQLRQAHRHWRVNGGCALRAKD